MEIKKTYIIDIDGTVCTNTYGEYESAKPFSSRIEKINKLYEEGHTIIYWTARGMTRFKGDAEKAESYHRELLTKQLTIWGAKYHSLRLGKPHYDHFVCDKASNDADFFKDRYWSEKK